MSDEQHPRTPPPDLEPDEAGLWREVQATPAAAGTACPHPLSLRAYLASATPAPAAPGVESHVRGCRICRAVLDDLAALDLDPLAAGEAQRIRARVFAGMQAAPPGRRAGAPPLRPLWQPIAIVACGLLFAAVAGVALWRLEATRLSPRQAAVPLAAQAVFHLDKPPVDLPAALVWRGATAPAWQEPLRQALLPYRDGDYAAAAARLAPLTRQFVRQPEPLYYLGLCQLFLGQDAAAAETLQRAATLAGGAQAQSAAWYRSLALIRGGQPRQAEAPLAELCRSGGLYATRACIGLQALATTSGPPTRP